ncbi:MAG: T9SS type A sorting domain-containing protein, partial [Ignavibacteria bacterium]|nr:T9SS type A sorting domain-containing protein [Ignavibacteria bacterium]
GQDTRLTFSSGAASSSSIGVSDFKANIIWCDTRDGNQEIYYKLNPNANQVGITPINSEIPDEYSLSQNYPNPFNPVTNINFQLPRSGSVKLTVFDMLGKEVETLVNENLNAGTYNADWNASNHSSGVYFYKIQAGDFSEIKKMVLVK